MTEAKQNNDYMREQKTTHTEDVVVIVAERVDPARGCELKLNFFGDTPQNNKRWWQASDVASSFPNAYAKWRNSVIDDEPRLYVWLPLLFLRQIGVLLEVNLLMTVRGCAMPHLFYQVVVPICVVIAMQFADNGVYSFPSAHKNMSIAPRTVPDLNPCVGESCTSVLFAPPTLSPGYLSTLQEVAARTNLQFEDFVPLERPSPSTTSDSMPGTGRHDWCIGRTNLQCPGAACPSCAAQAMFPQLPDGNSCDLPAEIEKLSRAAKHNRTASGSPFVPLLLPCAFFRDLDLLSMRMKHFPQVQHALQLTGQYVHDAFAGMVSQANFVRRPALPKELLHLGVDDGYVLWLNVSANSPYPQGWPGEQSLSLKRVVDEVIMLRKLRTVAQLGGPKADPNPQLSVHVQWAPCPIAAPTRDAHLVSDRYGTICLILPITILFCGLFRHLNWEHTSGMLVQLQCMGLLPLARLCAWLTTGAILSLVSAIVTCACGGLAGMPFFVSTAASSTVSLFAFFGLSVTAWCLCLAAFVRRLPWPATAYTTTPWVVVAMFINLLSACSPSLLSLPSASALSGLVACLAWTFPAFHFARGYGAICGAEALGGQTMAALGLGQLQTELPSLEATLGNLVALTMMYFVLAACFENWDLIGHGIRVFRTQRMRGGAGVTPASRDCERARVQLLQVSKRYRTWCGGGSGGWGSCCRCGANRDAPALRAVSLTLNGDAVVAVMGRNGAGGGWVGACWYGKEWDRCGLGWGVLVREGMA